MKNFALEMYRQMLVSLKRGNSRGVMSNAKPAFCLALIEFASKNRDNKIIWGNSEFVNFYEDISKSVNPSKTPIVKPFYHLSSEPFYTLLWKEGTPENIGSLISAKFLREHLEYAKLDDELWKLLQDADNREYLKKAIIKQYLSTDKI